MPAETGTETVPDAATPQLRADLMKKSKGAAEAAAIAEERARTQAANKAKFLGGKGKGDSPKREKPKDGSVPAPMKEDAHKTTKLAGALALAEAQQELRSEEAKRRTESIDSVYYLECQASSCLGPGIWIYNNPGQFGDADWESSYHPRGAAWPMEMKPYCQVCYEKYGHKRPLRVFHLKNGRGPDARTIAFQATPRFTKKITKAEYTRLTGVTV